MRSGKSTWLWLGAAAFVAACGGRAGFEVGEFDDSGTRGGSGNRGGGAPQGGTSSLGGTQAGGVPTGGVPSGGTGGMFGGGVGGVGNAPTAGFAGFGGFGGFAGSPGGFAGMGGVSGMAGFAGMAGMGAGPMLGDPCTVNGELRCHGFAQKLTLRCDGGFWRANGTCALNMNCDSRNGVCTPIAMECVNRAPLQRFCRGDELVQCGVDNVTVDSLEMCVGRCVEDMMAATASCAPPNCGDGRVQSPEACDDGNMSSTDDCTIACANAACGDGFVWATRETCDDFNTVGRDGCSPVCLKEPRAVSAGSTSACALAANGAVQCWGYNVYGQLGIGDTSNRGDSPGEVGPNLPVVDLGSGRTAKVASTHILTTCAILDNDSLKCWGYNGYGQLGQGDTLNRGYTSGQMGDALPAINLGTGRRAKAVAVGGYHTCAILDDDSLKCWGYNLYGTLGLGDTLNRGDSGSEMGDALPVVNLGAGRTALAISAGIYSTCAILDNRSVKCWGYNVYGQLGLGDTLHRGDAMGEMGDALQAVDLGAGRSALAIGFGTYHVCAVLDDYSLKCWGYNTTGQLGLGDTLNRGDAMGEMGDALPRVSLGSGYVPRIVSGGDGYTCTLSFGGQVKCWGSGTYGRLGLGDSNHRGDATGEMGDSLPVVSVGTNRAVLSFEVGATHACALLDDLSIKCWGQNAQGSLGLGDSNHRGDTTGEMGDTLPAVPVGF
jgi:cysteine-rich repeat protein